MSQAVFARYLNVSTKLVQAWEAGRLTPDGVAAHHRIVAHLPIVINHQNRDSFRHG